MGKDKSIQPKQWEPNEAPTKSWIKFFVIGYLVSEVVSGVAGAILKACLPLTGAWAWVPELVSTFGGFAVSFVVLGIILKRICKTSMHDLIFGRNGSFDLRVALIVLVCWLVGFIGSMFVFPDTGESRLNDIGIAPILVNILIAVVLIWMQTTWEEVMFRGVMLRATCGDELRPTNSCIIGGIAVSLLFMGAHLLNPEVTSQESIFLAVAMSSTYFISAFLWYMLDVAFGSCLPGCVIHAINNITACVLISSPNSRIRSATIFLSDQSLTGVNSLINELITYIPLIILCVAVFVMKSKKAKA